MSHDHSSMDMPSMDTGPGIPSLPEFQKYFWAFVGSMVAFGTAVNIINHIIFRQRLHAASKGLLTPAKPKSWFFVANATATALMREASNASFLPFSLKGHVIRVPTFGRTFLVLIYGMVLMVFCFYGLNPKDRWQYEDIGYRTGWISICQLPLVFLLAGKNNIIGYLTGASYERLNWMHRWAARCLLLTTTIHMAFWFRDWWPYGDYVSQKIKTDPQANKGFIAWILIVWISLSSSRPVRSLAYEVFVVQHFLSFTALITFIYLHAFPRTRKWVWIPVGIFFFDRTVRGIRTLYVNLSIFHPRQRKQGSMAGLWACKAEFSPLPHNSTKITIRNPPTGWTPGQHVLLSCHSLIPLQSHPFTISSIPQDGEMTFIVKAENGGTKRFFHHAEKLTSLPNDEGVKRDGIRTVAIEGPYGSIRPLRQFDSVVLFAGSTGATYTIPLLRDLIKSWQAPVTETSSFFQAPKIAVTRHIRFVWVLKSRGQLEWFSSQLSAVMEDALLIKAQQPGRTVEISIYVTCDDSFTEEHKLTLASNSKTNSKPKETPASSSALDEKDLKIDVTISPREIYKRSGEELVQGCGPDGGCCCKTTIQDETPDAISGTQCRCGAVADLASNPLSPKSFQSSASSASHQKSISLSLHSSIAVLSGRPQCRNIIRRTLEQAFGESAIVVCGPKGLVDNVKQNVVRLSDERAVHKGTGAQGIYLHTESFGF